MLPIKRIIVHHTGDSGSYIQLKGYEHNLGRRIPYHYLIDFDGKLIKGELQDYERGAHIWNMNTGSLGIALLGDYSTERPAPTQINTLDNLILFLMWQYPGVVDIVPHNHYNEFRQQNGKVPTICPGPFITEYMRSQWGVAQEAA